MQAAHQSPSMSMDALTTAHGNELLRAVADRLPLLVWVSDSDNRCTFCNKAWLDFTGRALEREVGEGWTEGIHSEDLQHRRDACTRAFHDREPCVVHYRLRHHSGEYRLIVDHAAPLFDSDGALAGYIGA